MCTQDVAQKPTDDSSGKFNAGAAGRAAAVRRGLGMKMFTLGAHRQLMPAHAHMHACTRHHLSRSEVGRLVPLGFHKTI